MCSPNPSGKEKKNSINAQYFSKMRSEREKTNKRARASLKAQKVHKEKRKNEKRRKEKQAARIGLTESSGLKNPSDLI